MQIEFIDRRISEVYLDFNFHRILRGQNANQISGNTHKIYWFIQTSQQTAQEKSHIQFYHCYKENENESLAAPQDDKKSFMATVPEKAHRP